MANVRSFQLLVSKLGKSKFVWPCVRLVSGQPKITTHYSIVPRKNDKRWTGKLIFLQSSNIKYFRCFGF